MTKNFRLIVMALALAGYALPVIAADNGKNTPAINPKGSWATSALEKKSQPSAEPQQQLAQTYDQKALDQAIAAEPLFNREPVFNTEQIPPYEPVVKVYLKNEPENAPPPGIEEIGAKTQHIDKVYEEAARIPIPAGYNPTMYADLNEPILTGDEILDSMIKKENSAKKMDVDFNETTLENILRAIGDIAEVNIVLDPTLKDKTYAPHLKNTTIRDSLRIIADSYGLGFKRIGDTLYVTSKDRLRSDNMVTRVIKLRYIKPSEVKALTHNMPQTVNISEDSNAVMVIGTGDEVNKIEELIEKMDVSQPQVILEAKIIEISKDALKNLGVDWSDTMTTAFQERNRPVALPDTDASTGSPLKVYSFARNPVQFNTVIQMLENDNKAKVLSNPRIVTINNQQAEIFVGDRIPYTITTVAGGVATTEVRFVEPGIRLRITPSIVDRDFVVIKIEPEVSFIFSFVGPNNQYPWVRTRNATAFVRIGNKQPFILGGLLNSQDKKSLFKIPILGSLPLLGRLFSYQTHTVTDSELIIAVTPVIINQ